jgi:hypothetical protein
MSNVLVIGGHLVGLGSGILQFSGTTGSLLTFNNTITISGNQFSNGSSTGQVVGANVSGAEFGPIQGNTPGGSAFAGNEPTPSAMQAWGFNMVRLPINEASWMAGCPTGANASGIAGRLVWDSSGVMRIADPVNNYQAQIIAQVATLNAAGFYVILDLHWTSPSNIAPTGQDLMANSDNSIAFWTSVANTFGFPNGTNANQAVLFETFNEPYPADSYGGTFSGPSGTCTGGSTTTIIDSAQTWATNQWIGATIKNNTTGHSATVTSNTATTLTFAAMASANSSGNSYTFTAISSNFQLISQGGSNTMALSATPTFTKIGILQLSSYTGIFYPGDTITQGSETATVQAFDPVNLKIYYSNPSNPNNPFGVGFTTGTVTKTAGKAAMTCLTRAGQGGIATGGSTTTMTDTSRTWTTNEWAAFTFYDVNSQLTVGIASNTSNTLTFSSSIGTAVAAQDQYMITKPLITPQATSSANGPTTFANNGIFGNTFAVWRTSATPTSGAPQEIAYFINNPAIKNVLIQWGNDPTFNYNEQADGGGAGSYFNIPDTYTIDVNSSTSATMPTTGWLNAATVTGNLYSKRAHLVALQGGMWVRMNFTAATALNASGNTDVAMVIDIWDATHGVSDGIVHVGDSITALAFDFTQTNHVTAPFNVDALNNMANGYGVNYAGTQLIPPVLNAGMSSWTAQQYLGPTLGFTFAEVLAANPSRYISITLGTNNLPDWNNGTDPASYTAAMQTMVTKAQQAGKVVIVNTIPWLSDATHQAGLATYNGIVTGTIQAMPGVVNGVDFATFFNNTFTSAATGGSTTTVVDTAQNWAPNAYIGVTLAITSGPNNGSSAVVTSNTQTSMTFVAMGSANAAGNTYSLNGQSLISSDGIHPNSQGLAAMRRLSAFFLANLPQTATATVSSAAGSWTIAGHQQMINTIRSTGATNPIFTSGDSFDADLSGWLANVTTDPKPAGFSGTWTNQMGASWHPYPPQQSVGSVAISSGGTGWTSGDVGKTITLPQPMNNTVYTAAVLNITAVSGGAITGVSINNGGAYLQAISNGPGGSFDTNLSQLPTNPVPMGTTTGGGSGATFNLTFNNLSGQDNLPTSRPAVETIKAAYPVLITETGESSFTGWVGAPWTTDLFSWANSHGISILGWEWDLVFPGTWALILNSGGTPAPGYGVIFKAEALSL